jgi:hypothetical protein
VWVWWVCRCGHGIFLPVCLFPLGTAVYPLPCPRAQGHACIHARRVGCPRVRGYFMHVAIFKSDTARTWRTDGTVFRLPHRPLSSWATRPVPVLRLPLLAGFENGLQSINTAQSEFPFTLAQVEKVFAQQEYSLGCLLSDWYLWMSYSHLLTCVVWFMNEFDISISLIGEYSLRYLIFLLLKIAGRAHPCLVHGQVWYLLLVLSKLRISSMLYYYMVIMMVTLISISANGVITVDFVCQLG